MKKCAVINDISGFGKCSMTAALPIMSALGIEVHPLLTAVLSNQTAYPSFSSFSLTKTMEPFIDEWKKLGAAFDGILTGFVTDRTQLEIISHFIDEFNSEKTIVVVDPVMADNGALYDGYDTEMCDLIRDFCLKSDVITPNTTELSILAERGELSFNEEFVNDFSVIEQNINILNSKGINKIVVTGHKEENKISNIVFDCNKIEKFSSNKIGGYFSGTGDVFACVLTGALLKGKSLGEATDIAGKYITKTINATTVSDGNDGIAFEKTLKELTEIE